MVNFRLTSLQQALTKLVRVAGGHWCHWIPFLHGPGIFSFSCLNWRISSNFLFVLSFDFSNFSFFNPYQQECVLRSYFLREKKIINLNMEFLIRNKFKTSTSVPVLEEVISNDSVVAHYGGEPKYTPQASVSFLQ